MLTYLLTKFKTSDLLLSEKTHLCFGFNVVAICLFISSVVFSQDTMAEVGANKSNEKTGSSLDIVPIELKVLQHEKQLFQWNPEFNLNVPSFDSLNRPYIRGRSSDRHVTKRVYTIRNNEWITLDIIKSIRKVYPNFQKTVHAAGWLPSRIVFDSDDYAYTLLKIALKNKTIKNLLLYSRNYCKDWQIFALPPGNFAIEHSATPVPLSKPPAIFIWEKTKEHPAQWASYHKLQVLFPKTTSDGLDLGKPIQITESFLGFSQHSGGSSFAVTKNKKTHLVWVEVANKTDRSTPIYAATFDRESLTLNKKLLIAHAQPINDNHNSPGICMDNQNYIHVITGAHGRNFFYIKSKKPNDIYGGWTKATPILNTGCAYETNKQRGRQTYLSLVCDSKDTLHVVCRQYRKGVDHYHGGDFYMALSYQRKKKDQPWEDAKLLVIPPMSGYSIYYHKLAVDRKDNLYLNYSYWNPTEKYKLDGNLYNFRSMLCSKDHGNAWNLAMSDFFLQNLSN